MYILCYHLENTDFLPFPTVILLTHPLPLTCTQTTTTLQKQQVKCMPSGIRVAMAMIVLLCHVPQGMDGSLK